MRPNTHIRWGISIACLLGLLVLYLFQETDFASWIGIEHRNAKFLFNKSTRFLLNDFLMLGIIYSIFIERKYIIFTLGVQVFGFLFILIPYFLLKLVWLTGNGPLVSFLHRLVLNPVLLLLLIPSFYALKVKTS